MEIGKLAEWNPWWENKARIKELAGKMRQSYALLEKSVSIKEITIITGVRRSGKSTIMYQMIQNLLHQGIEPKQILFVNFEDKKLAQDGLEEIYSGYRENMNPDKKAYIFLDEIHKKDGWESWIRKQYDQKADCKFVISGSCSHLLKKEYSTLLTGRNLTFEIFPLSFKEYLGFSGIEPEEASLKKGIILPATKAKILNALKSYMAQGGFPEIFFKEEQFKMKILEQYFDDIIFKDIIDRFGLNSKKVMDFALLLATNFTGTFSLRNVRAALKLSYDAAKDYLSHFSDAFLFFPIDHFSYSFKEQKTLPSKVYCIDNGMRNAVSFKFSEDIGRLAENLVCIELKRRAKDVYYWKGKGEVDFLIKEKDQTLEAVNICYGEEINERETKALKECKETFKEKVKRLVIITKDVEKEEEGIKFIPLWKWLLVS